MTKEPDGLQFMGQQRVYIRVDPGCLDDKESTSNVGGLGLTPASGRYPGEGHGKPLQDPCLESHGQKSLVDSSPRGWRVRHG